jgi:hypothetical protein
VLREAPGSVVGTFPVECLDANWLETWRGEYSESRPHRALGEKTPNEFANKIAASPDLIGLQTAENSGQSWYRKAGPIRDVDSPVRTSTKTRAGQAVAFESVRRYKVFSSIGA